MFVRRRKRAEPPGVAAAAVVGTGLEVENLRLQQTVHQLSLLNDLVTEASLDDNSEAMIRTIVHRVKQTLDAEQVMVYLLKHDDVDGDILTTKVREDSGRTDRSLHFDAALCATMGHHRTPFLTNDPGREPRLAHMKLDPGLRSLLCVPLRVRGSLTGVITACNKYDPHGFTDQDLNLLSMIANQSAQILDSMRLREEQAAYARLLHDLRVARDIQATLLPTEAPQIEGYDIAGCSRPAESVGGDYFDYIPLPDGRLAICLGDVSGKGISASLLMANLQATLRGQAQLCASASECMTKTNQLLFHSTTPERFATLFYGILDPRTHELNYCNAGHERPLLMSCSAEGKCAEELAIGGICLGMFERFAYQEGRVRVPPDSLLLLYSDGLTDAADASERPFGIEGVEGVLRAARATSAREVVTALLAAVRQHVRSAPTIDDLTLVAMRRL